MAKFTMPMLLASAALLAAMPAAAQYASHDNYNPPAPDQYAQGAYDQSSDGQYAQSGGDQDQRPRHQRGMHLSLEQRAMLRAEIQHQMQTQNIPREQRKAYRQQIRAEWRSMDPGQRQQKFAEVERHWNALPADRRQKILANISQHKGHRGQGQGGQGNRQYQDRGDQYRNGGGRGEPGGDEPTEQ